MSIELVSEGSGTAWQQTEGALTEGTAREISMIAGQWIGYLPCTHWRCPLVITFTLSCISELIYHVAALFTPQVCLMSAI